MAKTKKNRKQRRKERLEKMGFYGTREWLQIRVDVLEKYECKCMMCGRSPKKHGIVIHVDHIKPISKYPHLKLHLDNLQILCDECNLGKSNRYKTDWRPCQTLLTDEELAEIELAQQALDRL